jgi:formylmethanofuran dehydrogenase subunit E
VCPTGHITYRESQGERQIWGRTFHLVRCSRCGDPFATREQLELVRDRGDVCPRCLREEEGLALRDG